MTYSPEQDGQQSYLEALKAMRELLERERKPGETAREWLTRTGRKG